MTTFTETIELTQITCGQCGGIYAINERYRAFKYEHSGFWNCPYCRCSWGYSETENSRLRKQLEAKAKEVIAAKCEALKEKQRADSNLEANLKLSKKLNRVQKGVCPDCQRSFTNLRRHMETCHHK